MYTKLRNLESKQSELKNELSNAADEIKYTSQSSDQKIASLEKRIKTLTSQRDEVKKALTELQTNLEWENRKLKSELETANSKQETLSNENKKMQQTLDEANKKLGWIRKQKAASDAEVEKLTNQVKLLKKELYKE